MMAIRKTLTPVATALMQQAMIEAPRSLNDLVEISGLAKPVVTRYVNALYHAEPKMVHVAGWARDARRYPTIRQFAWGNKDDVACPVSTKTNAERMRDLRAMRKGAA